MPETKPQVETKPVKVIPALYQAVNPQCVNCTSTLNIKAKDLPTKSIKVEFKGGVITSKNAIEAKLFDAAVEAGELVRIK